MGTPTSSMDRTQLHGTAGLEITVPPILETNGSHGPRMAHERRGLHPSVQSPG